MTLFRAHNVRSAGQVRELTEAFQRAGAASAGRTRGRPAARPRLRARRCSSRPTRRAASSSRWGGLDAVRRQHGPRRGRRPGWPSGSGGDRARGAGDGRQRRLRAGPGPRDEPGQPGPRDPLVRRLARGRRPHGAAMVRGLQAAGVAAAAKHFPGLGPSERHPPRAGGRLGSSEPCWRPASSCRSGGDRCRGPARDVGPHRAAGPDRRDDLPATLSRAVMTDLLRRDLGFGGLTITDALDMGALAQGAAQVARRRSPRSAPASTCCSLGRPGRWPGSRRRSSVPRPASCSIRPRWPPGRRVAALRAWLAGRAAPDLSVVGAPRTWRSRRAGRAVAHAGPRPGRAPAAAPATPRRPGSSRSCPDPPT